MKLMINSGAFSDRSNSMGVGEYIAYLKQCQIRRLTSFRGRLEDEDLCQVPLPWPVRSDFGGRLN